MSEIAPLISRAEFSACVLHEDADLLVVNKPPWLVCHPSKQGPWSSLAGAAREYLGQDTIHLISRLDRETSGVVVIARNPRMAAILQKAQMAGQCRKSYIAILTGELSASTDVDAALGPDPDSPVAVIQKTGQGEGFQSAQTRFEPLAAANGFTLSRVIPVTGRKHQIRAHARHIGHWLVGDKLYGPDPLLYLEFVEHGLTEKMAEILLLSRQALHAQSICFDIPVKPIGPFRAPLARDLKLFVLENMGARVTKLLQDLC